MKEQQQQARTFNLTVDGKQVELTEEQAIAQLQKGLAAERRLEEATNAKKQAEQMLAESREKVRIGEQLMAARNGDPDAQRAVAKLYLDTEDDGLDEYLQDVQGKMGGGKPALDNGNGTMENNNQQAAQLPEGVVRTLKAFEQFAKPLVDKGYSLQQVGEILGTGISKQSVANRDQLIKQAVSGSDKLKSLYKKDPEKVSRMASAFAAQRQGGSELTDDAIRLAVQDTEEALGGFSASNEPSNPDIALGEMATLDGYGSGTKKANLPNMFDEKEKADNALGQRIVELIAGGEESAEA